MPAPPRPPTPGVLGSGGLGIDPTGGGCLPDDCVGLGVPGNRGPRVLGLTNPGPTGALANVVVVVVLVVELVVGVVHSVEPGDETIHASSPSQSFGS